MLATIPSIMRASSMSRLPGHGTDTEKAGNSCSLFRRHIPLDCISLKTKKEYCTMTEQNSQGKSSDTGTYDNVAETPISPSKDLISLLQEYEDGVLGPEETTQLFQELIDSGYAWQLQHHYGKT